MTVQSSGPAPLFSAERRALGFDIGGVDGDVAGGLAGVRQRLEHPGPEPLARPAVEAIVDGRVRAIFRRTIQPAAADLQDVENAGDDATIILAVRAGLVPGHEGLDHRPLCIAKPKQRLVHSPHAIQNLSKPAVNHDLPRRINALVGFGA